MARRGWWIFRVVVLTASGAAAAPLQIVTDSLPAGTVGVSYIQQIAVTGGSCTGVGTATNMIDSGALPGGFSVTSPSGVEAWTIQGVPTNSGTSQFVLHIKWSRPRNGLFDPGCTDEATKALSITIQATGPPPPPPPPPTPTGALRVDRTQISTTYHIAHLPTPFPETVHVTSAGTAVAAFTVQASTSSGGDWLSVTPLIAMTPAPLIISFSISGLPAGVYSGSVSISSGASNPVMIGVSLTVVADANIVLTAAPPSLSFSFVTGGTVPQAQSVTITAAGDRVIFLADLSAPPNGKWLSVSPAGAVTSADLSVTVDPKNLAAGTYNGTITLHLSGITTVAQTIAVVLTVQSAAALPAITQSGVVNAANLTGAIAPGTWVSIFGSNLSATTRQWRDTDFVASKLPTTLDGVSVTINGNAAAVAYVSPTQINVLAPDETATGLVSAQVTAPAGTSGSGLVLEQTAAPAFFQFRAPAAVYVAGTHADGSYLAGAALVQQGLSGTPAKPGETIVVYGTGFGTTQPPISATALVPSALALANPQELRVRIGGVDCAVAFAGLISPGLYQFNVVVPQVPDGDLPIVAELRGLLTRADLLVTVQH